MATINPRKRSPPPSKPSSPKKKKQEDDDIRCVIYNSKTIITPVASIELKQMLLDRFKEDFLPKLDGGWCRRNSQESRNVGKLEGINESKVSTADGIVRSRLVIGINQCTRMLEKVIKRLSIARKKSDTNSHNKDQQHSHSTPSLIILTRDVRPATIIAHIPIYAHLLKVPILILPGRASVELGSILGIKSVAVAMFLSRNSTNVALDEEVDVNDDIDSFVNFATAKIS